MPDEGLSNGGLFEVKELEVTENGTYEQSGEMYNKVIVNVEGGGGSSDFSTAEVTVVNNVDEISVIMPCIVDIEDYKTGSDVLEIEGGDEFTITVPIYKGNAYVMMSYISVVDYTIEVTGDITVEGNKPIPIIHGNGTITFNPTE